MSDIISDILFEVFDCEGVVMAEETYKDLEMINSTEGTLKAFIRGEKPDYETILKEQKRLLNERGWTEYRLAKECGLSESTLANIFRRNSCTIYIYSSCIVYCSDCCS